jgi:hypothetical protein
MQADSRTRVATLATILAVGLVFLAGRRFPVVEVVIDWFFTIFFGACILLFVAASVYERVRGSQPASNQGAAQVPIHPWPPASRRQLLIAFPWFALAVGVPGACLFYFVRHVDTLSGTSLIGLGVVAAVAFGVGLLFGVRSTSRAAGASVEALERELGKHFPRDQNGA